MKICTIALLALVVSVNGFARLRHPRNGDNSEKWQKDIDQFVADSTEPEGLKDKISDHYSKLTEGQADFIKHYRKQCTAWIKKVASDEEKVELRVLYEKNDAAVLDEKIKDYITRLSEAEKAPVLLWKSACAYLWNVKVPDEAHQFRRYRRSSNSHNILSTEWLTEDQSTQLSGLKGDEFDKKYLSFYKALTGDAKKEATKKIVKKCYGWLDEVASLEEKEELHKLHHSDHAKCKEKVKEYLQRVPAEERGHIQEHLDVCEEVWYEQHGRHEHHVGHHHQHRRRRHHTHTFEEFSSKHLGWLSDDQKSEVTALKDDKPALKAKLNEFFEKTSGEKRTEALNSMKGACRDLLHHVLGEEKAKELKTLKESGATPEALKAKFEEFLAGITDEHLKAEADEHKADCMKLFLTPSRRRRNHHHAHEFEEWSSKHLGWLTDDQRTEINSLKDDKAALKTKINEFFEKTSGEKRTEATQALKAACRGLMHHVLGDEKAKELKALKESGATSDALKAKLEELLTGITDEHLKEEANEHKETCMKLLTTPSRKRRDHHHGQHKLEDYFKTHLSWLSDSQKDELRQLKTDGKTPAEIQNKVFEFYDAATGETKEKAKELMQGGCRELLRLVVGNEKADELKTLKESGASPADLEAKTKEFVDAVTDEHKKKLADTYGPGCKRIFGVASRKRRDHHEGHHLEDYLKTHLSWLTSEQAETLKTLKAEGKTASDLQKKVFEFYEATTGEARTKATELLQGGCRELIKSVVGEDKAAELKKMKESGASNDELSAKVKEFVGELTDPKKKELAVGYEGACKKIFGVQSRKRRHEGKHGIDDFIENHLTWLTAEQKAAVNDLKTAGNVAEIKTKVNEYFEAATGETKTKATEELQGACRELYTHILGDKAAEVKALKESGASNDEVYKKIEELLAQVTDEEKKTKAAEYKQDCKKLFGVSSRKRRDHHEGHHLEDYLKTHLSWLTSEQAETLKTLKAEGKTPEELSDKVFEFYDAATGETKTKATELLQGGCRDLIKKILGDEKAEELKKFREAGASVEETGAKAKEMIEQIADPEKKALASKYEKACKRVFGAATRKRRDHKHDIHENLEEFAKHHLNWLTDDQKDELMDLKDSGKDAIKAKIEEFYKASSGAVQAKATIELQAACQELINQVIGEDKAAILQGLRDSKATSGEIQKKTDDFLAEVPDERRKNLVLDSKDICTTVLSRKRREHTLEDYLKTHLSWLTKDQADILTQMKAEKKHPSDLQAKVFEFYEAATGETKTKATELLQGGCRDLLTNLIGEEKAAELKKLRESGASHDDISSKIKDFMSEIEDPEKKRLAVAYEAPCKKIFGVQSRKRRHEGKHGIDDFIENHLTWLTAEQKAAVNDLKTAGNVAEIKTKVNEYFEAATGETKTKATEELQGACRELYTHILGDKAAEVKALKESGASNDEVYKKIEELLAQVTDEEKKTKAAEYKQDCKKVFGVSSRKRRDHHHGQHKLEDYFKTHLSWLSDSQKDELRQLKTDGKTPAEIQNKVFEFYDAATGETKEKAKELMQGGCRELLRLVVGNEKADELKTLKESGASPADLEAKTKEFVDGVTDEHKKKLADTYGPGCKRIFGVSSRKRRDHDHGQHKLEDYFKNHYSWLTDEQKDVLRQLKADGKTALDMQNKAIEFLDSATGEAKVKGTELMQGGCRELIRVVLGGEKADELRNMRESGSSVKELDAKLQEFLGEVTDAHKKNLAETYGPGCRKLFGIPKSSRKRRDHHHGQHKLEDYFKTHLSWLSDSQKDELRQLKTDGKTPAEIQNKVFEFYDAATGETKEKAKELMQGGCRELLRLVVGNEKADELKTLKESGASPADLEAKTKEFVDAVTDEHKKKLADTYGPGCKRIFGVASRKRRAFKPAITHMDFMRAVVKNEDKPEISHRQLTYELMDIYDAESISERARMVVLQCHSLFGEVVTINPYKSENSLRELQHAIKSASNRQLKAIEAISEVCRKTVNELQATEGRHGSIGDTLNDMLEELDDEPKNRLKNQWKSRCMDWILDVTDEEEREDLSYLLRMKRLDALRERITELMARFDDKTRTSIGHMRPVCEKLLGFTHNFRKAIRHQVPATSSEDF